jgi:hypothetical protein
MGRKGDSKRKTRQKKSDPSSSGTAGGSVSSIVKAAENQPARSLGTDKDNAGGRPSSDKKKKSRKG